MQTTKTKKVFNFSEAYFKKDGEAQLKALRNFKEPELAKTKTVTVDGKTQTVFTNNGKEFVSQHMVTLTSYLEKLASVGAKVSIV